MISPIYELRVEKHKPAGEGWTEIYYQLVREGRIKTYAGHHDDGLRDVTFTFDNGWGVSRVNVNHRRLRPEEAQKINRQIQVLEEKAQSAQPTTE